jgi:LysW-gamma-L-lysine carboxypeptidase
VSVSVAVGTALDPAALLDDLLRIPSPTGAVDAAAARLAALAGDAGFDVERDGAGNVRMSWGSGDAAGAVVLLGHLDTVPGDIPVRLTDGCLHGRGAVDAKGPLAAALAATSRLERRADRPVVVIAACDEEGASLGARHLRNGVPPAALIVLEPSGWDTITTGYRGCVRLSATVTRGAAHHAGPESGAADCLVDALAVLRSDLAGTAGRAVDRVQVRVNALTVDGAGGAESATAGIELRIPLGAGVEDVLGRAAALLGDATIAVHSSCEAVAVSRSNPAVRALARAISASGGRPRYTTKTGTSDLNVVLPAWHCPAAVYGPGDCALDHTPRESIDIAELRTGTDVLEAALRAL